MDQDAHMRRIIDNLSTDLNNLSSESKRKYASVKEACESSLLKLRQINSLKSNLYKTMCDTSADIIKPFILGCETKQSKIIQICLTSVQKVIEAKILNVNSASILINTLWQLTENSQEELKVLQTIILLVTTTDVVKHQYLAKTLTIGLRITSSKDQIVVNTATAMLSQMVTKVFERVVAENNRLKSCNAPSGEQQQQQQQLRQSDIDQLKLLSKEAPAWMSECAQDAYMLLQDIYLLLNSDHALWLINITDINKPFGLELLKSILVRYAEIFTINPEMSFVLKERICPLLIKLFSPTSKNNKSNGQSSSSSSSNNGGDQKTFAVVSRLIRIIFILVKNYFELLVTENEIFLSLLTKFLDVERPIWQKALAIEAFHKISVESRLIRLLVTNYDMKQHPEKIFSLITNGIALFIQSLFLNAATNSSSSSSNSSSSNTMMSGGGGGSSSMSSSSQIGQSGSSGTSSMMSSSQMSLGSAGGSQLGGGFAFQISSAQPSFIYKDTTIQLLFPYISGQVKSLFLDGWDKIEIPYIQDGYLLSIGFSTLQELCKSVQSLIDQNLIQFQQEEQEKAAANSTTNSTMINNSSSSSSQLVNYKKLNLTEQQCKQSVYLNECIQLMNACSNNFLFVYNILLESSLDESITDQIVKSVRTLIYICATLNLHAQRDAFVTLMCKAALPSSYAHNVLNLKSLTDLSYLIMQQQQQQQTGGGTQQYHTPVYNARQNKTNTAYDDSSEKQIQVVAIGPALHMAGANSTNQSSQSSSSSHHQSTLCITAKNLLTMKSILNMSHLYAELLGSSWYIVLNTLQHLTWTLGLKPTTGSNGQLKHLNNSILPPGSSGTTANQQQQQQSTTNTQNNASTPSSSSTSASLSQLTGGSNTNPDNNSMITTAIQTEIAFICNMLTKLFESTRTISAQALDDIVDSLLKLSVECSDLAYVRPEPCLFPLAKLFEASIANLGRVELFWQKVTMHFLCSCKHSNIKYREWCVDYICSLIRTTFNHKFTSDVDTAAVLNSSGVSGGAAEMRDIILKPLHELSSIGYNDIRQKQIECTLTILRLTGPSLGDAWPLCLGIIGAIQPTHTDSLIRAAFQCLQLVVTDFLSTIRPRYLSLVIRVVAKFGAQEQDLNIALTAIVLLWNISDYMFQNSEKLNEELKKQKVGENNSQEVVFDENKYLLNDDATLLLKSLEENVDDESTTSSPYMIESVWMVLYSRLGQLCVDTRPAVRKSACQTLFCTISSHGSILNSSSSSSSNSLTHWRQLVWRVLFPLLEQVRHLTRTASRERDKPNTPNFLMHHSRDTAEKQWAETSVLTLAGVTRVFNSKYTMLAAGLTPAEFHRMWIFLLEIIQSLGLSRNSEIAQASLRGFHELLGNQNYFSSAASFVGASASAAQTVAAAAAAASAVTTINGTQQPQNNNNTNSLNGSNSNQSIKKKDSESSSANNVSTNATTLLNNGVSSGASKTLEINEWLAAWKTWLDIGNSLLSNNGSSVASNNNNSNSELMTIYCWPPPGQTFLTCYVDLVSVIVDKLAPAGRFTLKDFENFSQIIDKLLAVPVLSSDYSSFILMQSESNLSPLQNSCLNTIKNFIKLLKTTDASFHNQFISPVFHRLLAFVLFACYTTTTTASSNQNGDRPTGGGRGNEIVAVNSVVFGEKALVIVTNLYEETASNEAVIDNLILKTIIQTLYVPLSLKYSCPSATTWKLSIDCLFKILKKALPIAQKNKGGNFETMWLDLAKTFEDFLFTKNIGSPDLSLDQVQKDELIDCQLVELIRDDMLAHAASLPPQFIQRVLAILNRGSIYSTSNFETFIDLDSTKKVREEFSKTCFESLLRFSFINESSSNGSSDGGNLTRMALASMLSRCKEIVQRYAHDERLNGNVPLPRSRTNEMIGVLKAVCTLINALKKAPKDSVQATIWYQVIGLYPSLVECTTSPSPLVSAAVKDTLHHYFSFLRAPNNN